MRHRCPFPANRNRSRISPFLSPLLFRNSPGLSNGKSSSPSSAPLPLAAYRRAATAAARAEARRARRGLVGISGARRKKSRASERRGELILAEDSFFDDVTGRCRRLVLSWGCQWLASIVCFFFLAHSASSFLLFLFSFFPFLVVFICFPPSAFA